MDTEFVKEQDMKRLSPIMAPERQEESLRGNEMLHTDDRREYLETMRQDLGKKQEIDNSEWNGVFQRKNSSYMRAVKEANNQLHDYLLRPIPTEQADFESNVAEIESKYEELIRQCNTYLSKRTWAITPTGRARINMVKQVLQSAIQEKSRFKESAYDIFRSKKFGKGVLWGNTLNETRRATLHSDADSEKHTRGAVSDVLIIKNGNETFYYKKEEKLLTPEERIEKEILKNPAFMKHKSKLSALRQYLNTDLANPVASTLKAIGNNLSKYKPADIYWSVNNAIRSIHPKAKLLSESYIPFLTELCPVFANIFTMANVAGDAKIKAGSPIGVRNVATSRMAALLGISNLIPESKTVNLVRTDEKGNKVVEKGNAMREAKGENRDQINKKYKEPGKLSPDFTPEAVGMLSSLWIFDVICGQVDRNTSNVLYQTEKKNGKVMVTGIMGIDNDMSFGELSYDDIKKYKTGVLQLKPLESDGEVQVRYIDEKLASAIIGLTDNVIRNLMSDILSENELTALLSRFNGVRDMIVFGKLVTVKDWNEKKAKKVLQNAGGARCPGYLSNIELSSGEGT